MISTDFLIIGGGASGLACAVTLKRKCPDASVLILEKLSVPGKKILATGNGRCNLSNVNITSDKYHGDKSLASLVLKGFNTNDCLEFFRSVGLETAIEEGRIYPLSYNASSVRDLLLEECDNLGVKIAAESRVVSIEKSGSTFKVQTKDKTYTSEVCIMALGGKAAAAHGTDGDGYRILKALGIRYNPIFPALVRVKTDADFISALRGVRVHGAVSIDGLGCEVGEIQFTDGGVSGIAVMQFSGQISKRISNGEKTVMHIDLCPSMSHDEIIDFLSSRRNANSHITLEKILVGIMNEKLAKAIDKISENDSDAADKIKDFALNVTGTDSFKDAQVTHGGVSSASLKPSSLHSSAQDGLFICGELLDVDGICGGYNLHFAWGSGILAAKEAIEFASNK